MKKRIKRQKRVTLIRLLITSITAAVIATGIFAGIFRGILLNRVHELLDLEIRDRSAIFMDSYSKPINDGEDVIPKIRAMLPIHGYWGFRFMPSNIDGGADISSDTEGCLSAVALADSNGNIIATNELTFLASVRIPDENGDFNQIDGSYCCPDDRPEIKPLYDAYRYYAENYGYTYSNGYGMKIESVYLNREELRIIPHKCTLTIYKDTGGINVMGAADNPEYQVAEEREIEITIDDDDYELYEVGEDLRISFPSFWGYDRSKVNGELSWVVPRVVKKNHIDRSDRSKDGTYTCSKSETLVIGGEKYYYVIVGVLDEKADTIVRTYLAAVGAFGAVCVLIAVMWSLLKNAKNKARYAFEDYQKALINNLSHDMKTPLMAISGYAENAQKSLSEGRNGEAEAYLGSILENVAYTDSIVSRTLELTRLQNVRDIEKEEVDLRELAEKSLEKYAMLLGEKGISTDISGNFRLSSDRGLLTQVVENLISNAVKYTAEGGNIAVSAKKDSLTVSNTVEEKVDVTDLMMPFVKGDKARSGKSGSGLGLAIARDAAEICGMKLSISSEGGRFIAFLSK